MSSTTKTGFASIDKPWEQLLPVENYDQEYCKRTVYDMLLQSPHLHKESTALSFYGTTISTATMLEKIDEAAQAYYNLGVRKNDIVFMMCLNTPEMIYSLYGLNKIGAITEWFRPTGMSTEMLHDLMVESGTKTLVIVDLLDDLIAESMKDTAVEHVIVQSVKTSLPTGKKMAYSLSKKTPKPHKEVWDDRFLSWKTFIKKYKAPVADVAVPYEHNKTSMIVHTGGTTGPVKRVEMTDYNANSVVYQTTKSPLDVQETDSFCQLVPPMVAYSLEGIHLARFYGLNTHLIATYDRDAFVDIMLDTQANHYFTVPAFIKTLIDNPKLEGKDLSFVKSIYHGGEAIALEDDNAVDQVLADHGAKVKTTNGYGQNEEFGCFAFNLDLPDYPKEYGTCGIPLPGNVYTIIDPDTKEELPYGTKEDGSHYVGDLYVSGPTVMKGYTGRDADRNAETFLELNGMRFANTDDQAYIDELGKLWFVARNKRIVRSQGGAKIFTNVLENILNDMEEVDECCVVAAPHPVKEKVASCHIVLKEAIRALPEEEMKKVAESVIERLDQRTARMYTYYIPGSYEFLSEPLARTIFGKIDFLKLEQKNQKLYEENGRKELPRVRYS